MDTNIKTPLPLNGFIINCFYYNLTIIRAATPGSFFWKRFSNLYNRSSCQKQAKIRAVFACRGPFAGPIQTRKTFTAAKGLVYYPKNINPM
jgi:hypothetical protein